MEPIASCPRDAMGAMSSKYNDTPEKAARAFDATRDGFVIGEGAGDISRAFTTPLVVGATVDHFGNESTIFPVETEATVMVFIVIGGFKVDSGARILIGIPMDQS